MHGSAMLVLGFAGFLFGGLTALRGDGHIVEEARAVRSFSGVEISHGMVAEVTVGPETSVKIKGDANLLPHIETRVEDGHLVVGVKDEHNLRPSEPIRLTVVTPTLLAVEASGGSEVRAQATAGREFSISASGGSEIEITGIQSDAVTVEASGGSEISLSGGGRELTADLSGGSILKSEEIPFAEAEVDGSGGSEFHLQVLQAITGDLSGGSELFLKGHPPDRDLSLSGGSEVHRRR
jgi:hypothetical protein